MISVRMWIYAAYILMLLWKLSECIYSSDARLGIPISSFIKEFVEESGLEWLQHSLAELSVVKLIASCSLFLSS